MGVVMSFAYIGPGSVGSHAHSGEWAVVTALVVLMVFWAALLREERLKCEWCTLALALLGAITVGLGVHAYGLLDVPDSLRMTLVVPVLLGALSIAAGGILLALGRFLYESEVPAPILRATQSASGKSALRGEAGGAKARKATARRRRRPLWPPSTNRRA